MPDNATLDFAHVVPIHQPAPVSRLPQPPQSVAERMKIQRKLTDLNETCRAAQKWLAYQRQRIPLLEKLNEASARYRGGTPAELRPIEKQRAEIKKNLDYLEAEMKRLERLHGIREIKRICGLYQGVRNNKTVDPESYLRGQLAILREIEWLVSSQHEQ